MCKQLRKKSAQYCQTCQQPWQNVIDHSYVHGTKQTTQGPGHPQQYVAPWQSQQGWSQQWQQSQGRRRTPSPRQRSKSAKGNKTPRKNQGQPLQQPVVPMMPPAPVMMGPNMQMQMPMYPQMAFPYQQTNVPAHLPPLPPPDTPWQMGMPAGIKMPAPVLPSTSAPTSMYAPTMPSMPTAPCPPAPKAPANSMSDPDVRGLMSMMRGRQAELPEDMQKKVQAMMLKYGKQSTKDLHAAVSALDRSREEYDQAVTARNQHHASWKKFLADAVQMWQSYADQFVEEERRLQEQVTQARETFFTAKSELENAKLDAGEVLHPSDDELAEGENDSTTGTSTASKLTETMQGLATSLQNLHKEAETLVEEDAHVAKRPRTAPRPEDQDMPQVPGDGSSHFGKAG